MVYEIAVLIIAGIGAGIVTGLLGLSAVMVIAPLLIVGLGIEPFAAIGISLATDFFASITGAWTYYRKGNVDLKSVMLLLIYAILGVIIGSYFSVSVPLEEFMVIIGLAIAIIGVNLILKRKSSGKNYQFNANMQKKFDTLKQDFYVRNLVLVFSGLLIGLIAGAFGAGGGLMVLVVLLFLFDFGLHKAIGTSIAMMVFLSLFGAVSHYAIDSFSWVNLLIVSAGGIMGAKYSSTLANVTSERSLKTVAGSILIILGLALAIRSLGFFGEDPLMLISGLI